MNRILLLCLAFGCAAASVNDCVAQDWRDPAFQQPLPQYYPPNRYPLSDSEGLEEIQTSSPVATPGASTPSAAVPTDSSPMEIRTNTRPREGAVVPKPIAKRPVAKRLPKQQSTGKPKTEKKKTKPPQKSHPVINYDIYRDRSQFPIDPRKPCSVCRRPVGKCSCGVDHGECGLGNGGQPYQAKEPGGYSCGKNCPDKRPLFSVYWPRPFSAKKADGHPQRCNCDQCATRINDRFDHLINFKLIDYQRTDNGYCGPGADPFGCLGESKYQHMGFATYR